MSARDTIIGLLQEWFRLTQTEARAIEARSWRDVCSAQAAKSRLRPLLDAAMTGLPAAQKASGEIPDQSIRSRIGQLIAMEASNANLLAEQKRKAGMRMQSLVDARRNLARLRRSYLPRPDMVFDSYS
jgi:hypothetical protein